MSFFLLTYKEFPEGGSLVVATVLCKAPLHLLSLVLFRAQYQ